MEKHLLFWMIVLPTISGWWGCTTDASEKSVREIKAEGPISSIIRNPVTAAKPLDTVNVARIVFETTAYDFGEVEEGEVIQKTFTFTNEGREPLIITNARSTCGCTVPKWPKDPIAPGKTGAIEVQFNTTGKVENQKKPVTITANTFPPETKLYLTGFVRPKASSTVQ